MKRKDGLTSFLIRLVCTAVVAAPFLYLLTKWINQDWGLLIFPGFGFFEGLVIAVPDRQQWRSSEYRVFTRGRSIFYLLSLLVLLAGIPAFFGGWGPFLIWIYIAGFLLSSVVFSLLYAGIFKLCLRKKR